MHLPHYCSSLLAVSSSDRPWTQTHKQGFSVQRVKWLAAQQQSPTYLNIFIYSGVFALFCYTLFSLSLNGFTLHQSDKTI